MKQLLLRYAPSSPARRRLVAALLLLLAPLSALAAQTAGDTRHVTLAAVMSLFVGLLAGYLLASRRARPGRRPHPVPVM